MENKIDFDKEFQHLADWLIFSVEFKIDEVDERLDARICNALPDISLWFLFVPKPRDRFYDRTNKKVNSFRIYRTEISINKEIDSQKALQRKIAIDHMNRVNLYSLPQYDRHELNEMIAKQYRAYIKHLEEKRDLLMRNLFCDDMPLVLDGLIEQAKWGGSIAAPYYGLLPALQQIFRQPTPQRDYEFFYGESFLDSFKKAIEEMPEKSNNANPFYWTEKLTETKKANWIQRIKNKFKNYLQKRKYKKLLKGYRDQDYI